MKKVFVDGVEVGTATFGNANTINNATNHALTFCARDNGAGNIGNWTNNVSVDEVQIYRKALTDAQITDLADRNTGLDYIPNLGVEGSYMVTYTATDGSGYRASCSLCGDDE